jgi:hypothetical protein
MRVLAHRTSLNIDEAKAGKPVSAVALLALLAGAQDIKPGDEAGREKLNKTADLWNQIFEQLDVLSCGDEIAHAKVGHFVRWWQRKALLRPDPGADRRELVPLRGETEIHHHVFDQVLKSRRTMLERQARPRLPDSYAIPCRECGLIFQTEAPRFARSCVSCQKAKPYPQRLGVHELGGLPVFTGGSYPRGPQRPQYGWPTVCEHPTCVTVFLAGRRHEKYCPAHSRLSALQAKRRPGTPKHEVFRFFPNYSECDQGSEVRYDFVIGGEPRICIIGEDGYQARDEAEFRPLAFYASVHPHLTIAAAET